MSKTTLKLPPQNMQDSDLHKLFVLFIKGLSILPVVEGGHAHYLFLLVDDGKGQNVLYGPATAIQRLFLQNSSGQV